MRIYVEPPGNMSQAMFRVTRALKDYAPENADFVENTRKAELCVLHVIGFPDSVQVVDRLLNEGKKVAIIQYCLRTTQRPDIASWLPMWKDAVAVWSYYDLADIAKLEGTPFDKVNFYHSPLGVDKNFRRAEELRGRYLICTSGYVAESESVGEVAIAADKVGGSVFHLGPEMHLGRHVFCSRGMNDRMLARIYSGCDFVSGLRRVEGFELPAAEGLVCGARPIMYDQPHYRRWFDSFAEYIPENSPEEVVESLVKLFQSGVRPVREEERQRAIDWFQWEPIIRGFWRRVYEA